MWILEAIDKQNTEAVAARIASEGTGYVSRCEVVWSDDDGGDESSMDAKHFVDGVVYRRHTNTPQSRSERGGEGVVRSWNRCPQP